MNGIHKTNGASNGTARTPVRVGGCSGSVTDRRTSLARFAKANEVDVIVVRAIDQPLKQQIAHHHSLVGPLLAVFQRVIGCRSTT